MLAKRIRLQHFWFFGQHCNTEFLGSKMAAFLKSAALFGRTPRTRLSPALNELWNCILKAGLDFWSPKALALFA